MRIEKREFEVQVPKADGSGIAEKVTVVVPVRWDEELQDWLMTPEAHDIIDNTKARLIGLLLPEQFKELRGRYDFSQQEMGELFQVGKKSWTRWESGRQRPSRSINLLVRALYEGEISINYLLRRAGTLPKQELERSSVASYWQIFAHSDVAPTNCIRMVHPEHCAVLYDKGSFGGKYHELLLRVLQKQYLSSDRGSRIAAEECGYYTKPAPALESASTRFKFPSEA